MNLRLIIDFIDRYFVTLALITFLLFSWLIVSMAVESEKRNSKCVELGGIMVKTFNGHSCAKITKIEIN